jgi:hypothetical protein
VVIAYFQILSQRSPEWTEENHEPGMHILGTSQVLPLEPIYLVSDIPNLKLYTLNHRLQGTHMSTLILTCEQMKWFPCS